jgi:hypothetical protein
LNGEWFKVAEKNLQTHMRKTEEFFRPNEGAFRTYLFVLVDEGKLALQKMIDFIYQKNGSNRGACLYDTYLMNDNEEQFVKYYSQYLFYSPINGTVYGVYHIFNRVWERTIEEFFTFL